MPNFSKAGFTQVAGVLSAQEAVLIAKTKPTAIGVPYALEGRREELNHVQFLEAMAVIPSNVISLWITYLEDPSKILAFC